MKETGYGLSRGLAIGFEAAEKRIRETLKEQGFGVLTEIDVQRTLKDKIGAEMKRYKILGACNPAFAQKALATETEIGLMMPCNVIVYEGDDGAVHVSAIDPLAAMGKIGIDALKPHAVEVREKLKKAILAV